LKKKHDFFEEQRRAKKLGSSMIFESWIFESSLIIIIIVS